MIISLRRHVPEDQRGAAAVELTLLVPALLLILGLLVAGGRLWFARTTVNEAAQSAARAASLARSAAAATAAGRDAGLQSLATAGLRCMSTSVSISTAAFAVPAGKGARTADKADDYRHFAEVRLGDERLAVGRFIKVVGRGWLGGKSCSCQGHHE